MYVLYQQVLVLYEFTGASRLEHCQKDRGPALFAETSVLLWSSWDSHGFYWDSH